MPLSLPDKEEAVRRLLSQFGSVAVAFSGGADSSLLLRLAADVLGPGRVLALTARSCLMPGRDLDNAATWAARHGLADTISHRFIDIWPLAWDDFAANPSDRCYRCKSRVYPVLQEEARRQGMATLLDGTNADDLDSDRPGLKALRELGIISPLAAAGLSKEEVRRLGRELSLDNWDRPSASCLATRIPTGLDVTAERLALIGLLEDFLLERGVAGCRVRLDRWRADAVAVEVRIEDLARIVEGGLRSELLDFFRNSGMNNVVLDLRGR